MLAIECSKPAATKAVIGNTMASTLSVTLRPANHPHRHAHQHVAQHAADEGLGQRRRSLALAMRTTACPTAPWLSAPTGQPHQQRERRSADDVGTAGHHPVAQQLGVLTRPLAQAIASRLLPVKQFGAGDRDSTRPSENTRPPSMREAAKSCLASLATSVNISVPRPMKALDQQAERPASAGAGAPWRRRLDWRSMHLARCKASVAQDLRHELYRCQRRVDSQMPGRISSAPTRVEPLDALAEHGPADRRRCTAARGTAPSPTRAAPSTRCMNEYAP